MIPSSHSSVTWCVMVNALFGVYLLMSIKDGLLDITKGMIKKVIYFSGKKPSFYSMI